MVIRRTQGEQAFPQLLGYGDFTGRRLWGTKEALLLVSSLGLFPACGGLMLPHAVDEAVARRLDQKGTQLSDGCEAHAARAKGDEHVADHGLHHVDRIKLGP